MDYAITFQKVNHIYSLNSSNNIIALNDVNLKIKSGSFNVIVGRTGSGKSTLVKHINGLLKPSSGSVVVDGFEINNQTKEKELTAVRQKVGMVFQFPEKQLFGDTVKKDISFGPSNFYDHEEKVNELTMRAFNSVELPQNILDVSPFDLSGGQQRRVAIAGVLACNPQILILDEPTVGLDEIGQKNILRLIYNLYQERNLTVILVTHQMEVAADYSNNVIAIKNGKVISENSPREFFSNEDLVNAVGVDLPDTVKLALNLRKRGLSMTKVPITEKELITLIKKKLGE